MDRIRITKEFTFETGHALYGYDGKCRNIHGHSYHLSVTVVGTPISDPGHVKLGMVLDFGDLKAIVREEVVDQFDHATVFNKNTPHVALAETLEKEGFVKIEPSGRTKVISTTFYFASVFKN